jgi:hypothetical protein
MGGANKLEHDSHMAHWHPIFSIRDESGRGPYLREFEESLEAAREAFREAEDHEAAAEEDAADALGAIARDRILRASCDKA